MDKRIQELYDFVNVAFHIVADDSTSRSIFEDTMFDAGLSYAYHTVMEVLEAKFPELG